MKQYVPLKPTKRGFKVWVRADSVTGYFCDFNVYVGRETTVAEEGLGERVVSQLCKEIEGYNYHVYCDNFFTSVSLFESLLEHHVYACGTVRRDRKGFPNALKHVQLSQRGEYQAMQRNELVATVWRDKKDVVTLSTQSNPTTDHQVLRRQKDGTRVCLALKPSTSTTATWDEWTRETSFASTIMFGSSVRKIISTSFGSHLTPPSQMHLFCHSTV